MTMNYAKSFKRMIILFVILAVVAAVAIPLSFSQQISDAAMLKQQYAAMENTADRADGEHHHEDDAWKSQITPLSAVNYAIIGGLSVLWGVLVLSCWLTVVAWLYKSAVNEGMDKSLWPILGIFFNFFAVSSRSWPSASSAISPRKKPPFKSCLNPLYIELNLLRHNKDVLKGTDKETSKRRLIIMRNNIHNYIAKTAIDYANIQPEEIMDICLRQEGTLVEVDFNTEWMNYI